MTPIATPLYYLYESVDIWCWSRPGEKENYQYTHDKIRDPVERCPCAGPYGGARGLRLRRAVRRDRPRPDRVHPTETPASPARTSTTTGSGAAPTATDAPRPTATKAPLLTIGPTSAATDREALVALYNATDGENWSNSDNWLSDATLHEWQGVTTYDGRRVAGLNLRDNDLSGEIPAELGSLSNLTGLSLSGNDLSGEIPAELGSLSNLTALYLNGNELSGEIPAELGSLSNLTGLFLNDNNLSGEIPAELGSLSNLTGLSLSYNDLSGKIPAELGSLSNLKR